MLYLKQGAFYFYPLKAKLMTKALLKMTHGLTGIVAALLCHTAAFAQCTFTPTISPAAPIMCPDETDTLWTQPYDAYQWYKDGTAISGATQQYLIVDYWLDGGSSFTVGATQGGCTEISASVLVDGWVFLPPFVSTYGNSHLCPGDTVILQLMSPYTSSIQWYRDGAVLAGANDDSLVITEAGSYTVSGAPAVCPAYVAPLGLDIPITATLPPVLEPAELKLCNGSPDTLSTSVAAIHEWYQDGTLLPGATSGELIVTEAGAYYATLELDGCLLHTDTVEVENYLTGTLSISLSGTDLMATGSTPGISSFQWFLDGVALPGATGPSYHPTEAGNYSVMGMDNECEVTSPPFAYEPASVTTGLQQEEIHIYPNPVQDRLFISGSQKTDVRLYDLTGKMLLRADGPGAISLAGIAAGNYLILIRNAEGFVLAKEMIRKQ